MQGDLRNLYRTRFGNLCRSDSYPDLLRNECKNAIVIKYFTPSSMPLEGIFVFRCEFIVFQRYSRMLCILSRQRKQTACQCPEVPFHNSTHQKTVSLPVRNRQADARLCYPICNATFFDQAGKSIDGATISGLCFFQR